jgi:hypothetical protein
MKIGASLADVDPMQLDSSVSTLNLKCVLHLIYCILCFTLILKLKKELISRQKL